MYLIEMILSSARLRYMIAICFFTTIGTCHIGCQTVAPKKLELLQIHKGTICVQKTLRRKGPPSILVWDYDADKPLWWIEPENKTGVYRKGLSFKYGDIPVGYFQKYPHDSAKPKEPELDALIVFCLTFSYDTLFAASGENFAYAYVYKNGCEWGSVPLPKDAYTPEGWY